MARTEVYVDPSIDANSGTGTIGDPYGDLQYALDNTSLGSDGTRINIKAGTAEVLTKTIDWASGWSGAPTDDKPIIFQGYTSAAGDGGIGEIDGNATYGIHNSTYSYIHFIDMKMGNCGSARLYDNGSFCDLVRCELYGSSNEYMIYSTNGFNMIDCHVHTWNYTGGSFNSAAVYIASYGNVTDSYVDITDADGVGIYNAGSYSRITRCVIHANNVSSWGIRLTNGYSAVEYNSIYNAASSPTEEGIYVSGTGMKSCIIRNNIIEGFATGIYWLSSLADPMLSVSNNIFYNCSTNISLSGDAPFLQEDNSSAASSQFVDAANGDFTLASGADALQAASPTTLPGIAGKNLNFSNGAYQSAGGGSSATPYARMG